MITDYLHYYEHPNKYDDKEHKILLTSLFNGNVHASFDINEINRLFKICWRKKDWYYDFIVDILKNTSSQNNILLNQITCDLDIKHKEDFMSILKNMKFSFKSFLMNNFHKFDYSSEDINFIQTLFDFTNSKKIHPDYLDYSNKRDLFDYFGIIPSLLKPKTNSFSDADFRFLFRHFKNLTIKDQKELTIFTFFYDSYLDSIHMKTELYTNFCTLFLQENLNIINYLLKEDRNDLENKFLIFARPIVEKIHIDINIKDF